jgi:3-phenylpropionate/cinnamic acid dioxygenase small subunit
MTIDLLTVCRLYADYGSYADEAKYDEWLGLFADECSYTVMPKENYERGLPAGLIYCDSRAILEDRIESLRTVSKANIHSDRHIIGMPRITKVDHDSVLVEAPFSVFQTEQEGETRLFATGLYRDCLKTNGKGLKFSEKLVVLDTFAVPSLLATPL